MTSSLRAAEYPRQGDIALTGRPLGEGAMGQVQLAWNVRTGAQLAVKFIHLSPGRLGEYQLWQARSEVKALRTIRSEHVIRMFGHTMHGDGADHRRAAPPLMIALEYCPEGNFFDNIKYGGPMNELLARTYLRQLIQGIEDVHRAGVVHRDLKASNIMLEADFKLKIIDFGMAKCKTPIQYTTNGLEIKASKNRTG